MTPSVVAEGEDQVGGFHDEVVGARSELIILVDLVGLVLADELGGRIGRSDGDVPDNADGVFVDFLDEVVHHRLVVFELFQFLLVRFG